MTHSCRLGRRRSCYKNGLNCGRRRLRTGSTTGRGSSTNTGGATRYWTGFQTRPWRRYSAGPHNGPSKRYRALRPLEKREVRDLRRALRRKAAPLHAWAAGRRRGAIERRSPRPRGPLLPRRLAQPLGHRSGPGPTPLHPRPRAGRTALGVGQPLEDREW